MTKGTLGNPLTIEQALSGYVSIILPGHTVWLRGGVYNGDELDSLLAGTADAPITVKPYPGEIAIIDSGWLHHGAHVLWDCDFRIIFRWSGWTGRINYNYAETGLIPINGREMTTYTPGFQIRNAIFHDIGMFGLWSAATTALWYGCVMLNTGIQRDTRGTGYDFYIQNEDETPKIVKHTICTSSFAWHVHAYGYSGVLYNMHFIENTMFNAGRLSETGELDNILIGGPAGAFYGIVLDGNNTYGGRTGVHAYGKGLTGAIMRDNYLPDGTTVTEGMCDVLENNVTAPPDSGQVGRMYSDDYDAARAYLTIYNWDDADSAVVDVSAQYSPGDTLALWSVQAGVNEAGAKQDVAEYIVSAEGTITVDMRAGEHSVAVPYEWEAPPTTFPTFGAFVVEKQTGD